MGYCPRNVRPGGDCPLNVCPGGYCRFGLESSRCDSSQKVSPGGYCPLNVRPGGDCPLNVRPGGDYGSHLMTRSARLVRPPARLPALTLYSSASSPKTSCTVRKQRPPSREISYLLLSSSSRVPLYLGARRGRVNWGDGGRGLTGVTSSLVPGGAAGSLVVATSQITKLGHFKLG